MVQAHFVARSGKYLLVIVLLIIIIVVQHLLPGQFVEVRARSEMASDRIELVQRMVANLAVELIRRNLILRQHVFHFLRSFAVESEDPAGVELIHV